MLDLKLNELQVMLIDIMTCFSKDIHTHDCYFIIQNYYGDTRETIPMPLKLLHDEADSCFQLCDLIFKFHSKPHVKTMESIS